MTTPLALVPGGDACARAGCPNRIPPRTGPGRPRRYCSPACRSAAARDRIVRYPRSPAEWQEAADWARLFLGIEDARLFGLITGGPVVNIERCDEVIAGAYALGIEPRPFDELVDELMPVLLAGGLA